MHNPFNPMNMALISKWWTAQHWISAILCVCVHVWWFTWCHIPNVLIATKTQTHQHPLNLVSWLDEIESNDKSSNIAIHQFIYLFTQRNTLIAAGSVLTGNCVASFYGRSMCAFLLCKVLQIVEWLNRDANLMTGNIPNSMNHELNWAIQRDIFRAHFLCSFVFFPLSISLSIWYIACVRSEFFIKLFPMFGTYTCRQT